MKKTALLSTGVAMSVWLAMGALALGAACGSTACAATSDDAAAVRAPHVQRRSGAGGLEERVTTFAKALDLKPEQQAQLRKILLAQRDAVRKIWSDRAIMPAERAPATRAANERTGDEIRAILNDEQRKKYNAAKAATPRAAEDQRTVEQWLDASRTKQE